MHVTFSTLLKSIFIFILPSLMFLISHSNVALIWAQWINLGVRQHIFGEISPLNLWMDRINNEAHEAWV